jgi:HrpA-like RNA helicase
MPLPTLLRKGALLPGMGEKKEDLDKYVAVDYILEWFDKRINNPTDAKSVDDRIMVIESATGSGKSTTLPTELYLKFNKQLKGNIIVSQPRVLTTISIPNTIANIDSYKKENRSDGYGIEFGRNIGYSTKEYIKKPLEKGILFTTVGVLLQYLKNMDRETFLKKYRIIMLDEAHSRDLNLDVIFYYMKQLFDTTPIDKCPFLAIMSATLDVNKYAKYFKTKTIFKVTGTSYPIEDTYLKYDADNIITSTVENIKKIHLDNLSDDISSSDIVVFIPGQSFIKKIKEKIIELNDSLDKKIIPIALDSTIFKASNIDYQNVFADINTLFIEGPDGKSSKHKPTRKVIIGTNAIETGITIESLKYCIDLGLVNQLEYNPVVGSNILMVKPVTRAMSQQRRGRVGRTQPGQFFPIYTKKVFDSLLNIQYPEILTNDISISILNIIIVKYKDTIEKYTVENAYDKEFSVENSYNNIKLLKNINISKLNLLDEPSNVAITSSLEKLYICGAIYANGYPTQLGLLSNKIRMLSMENIKMILSGYCYGCNISDLITIACFIQTTKQNIIANKFKSFNNQFNNIIDSVDIYNYNKLKSRLFISCEMIDFLLFFYKFKKIIKEYNNNIGKIKEFCNENKVSYLGIMTFIESRDDILRDFLFNMNMNPFANSHINLDDLLSSYQSNEKLFKEFIEEVIKIKKCIYEGYKLNTATYDNELNEYISDYNGRIVKSDSYLLKNLPHIENGKKFIESKPKKILYDSLIIKKNMANNFEFQVSNAVSVMSGYINIDKTFY